MTRTSATLPNSESTGTLRSRGFTLIELLVAVAVAAILSGMAIVSLNIGGYDDQLRDEARRLFQLARIAADDAIFKTSEYGVRFTHREYTFYKLDEAVAKATSEDSADDDDDKSKSGKRRWIAVSDSPQLRVREWPEKIEVEVFVEGLPVALDEERDAKVEAEDDKLRPHLMFLSNGEILPNVEVQLRSTESDKGWRIGIDEDGVLALGLLEE